MAIEAFAPAKINLTLHVTGQRDDGYHLLDSLVMFVDVGDHLCVEQAETTSLTVTGPLAAGVPTDRRNLVIQAAEMMGVNAKITLTKSLPAAAGIGGGSSDAAATVRALKSLYGAPDLEMAQALALGADVPVCLHGGWSRMHGIGEQVQDLGTGPDWPMILINPRVSVPTGAVFQALPSKNNAAMPDDYPDWRDWQAAIGFLAAQRNDLEAPAVASQPVIGQVLREVQQSSGCALARMSGSGATCFGIFLDVEKRDQAVQTMRQAHPDWWIEPTRITT